MLLDDDRARAPTTSVTWRRGCSLADGQIERVSNEEPFDTGAVDQRDERDVAARSPRRAAAAGSAKAGPHAFRFGVRADWPAVCCAAATRLRYWPPQAFRCA